MRDRTSRQASSSGVHHSPTLNHVTDVSRLSEDFDVDEGIAVEHNHIGHRAHLDHPQLTLPAQQAGGRGRCRAQDGQRLLDFPSQSELLTL